MILLFFIPVGMILLQAFRTPQGSFTLRNLLDVLNDGYSWRIASFTVLQAFWSTFFALLLGLPGAYLLSHFQFRGKRLVYSAAQLPFVLPSILVVLGFVTFFGNSGMLNRALQQLFSLSEPPLKILYSFKAIIAAHAFYNFPIALSLVASYWQQLDRRQEYAAHTLGAAPARTFFSITLPRLLPAITAAASMIFLFCFTSFSIILVLGGGPQFTTLEVQIYQLARMRFDTPHAASFALFSLLISSAVLVFYILSQHRLQHTGQQISMQVESSGKKTLFQKLCIAGYIILVIFLLFAPLFSIVYRSFLESVRRSSETQLSLIWYRQLLGFEQGSSHFSSALSAIATSLIIAASVTLITAVLALSFSSYLTQMSRRKSITFESLVMMPMAVSSVIIGLGYSLIASRIDTERISYVMIAGAHIVITLPFMIRSVLPAYRNIHDTYTAAAMVLGSNPLQAFLKVQLPLLRPALTSGAVFVFAISTGEMHATMMLSDAEIITIPILLYRLIGSYQFYAACALGTLLMLICILLFGISKKQERHSW